MYFFIYISLLQTRSIFGLVNTEANESIAVKTPQSSILGLFASNYSFIHNLAFMRPK